MSILSFKIQKFKTTFTHRGNGNKSKCKNGKLVIRKVILLFDSTKIRFYNQKLEKYMNSKNYVKSRLEPWMKRFEDFKFCRNLQILKGRYILRKL